MSHLQISSTAIPRRTFNWLLTAWIAGVTAVHADTPRHPPFGLGAASVPRLMQWPRHVLHLVVKYQQNPLRAARAFAYAQLAALDAWRLAQPLGIAGAQIAAHRATSLMLEQLYPHEIPGQFEARFAMLASQCLARDEADERRTEVWRHAETFGREVAATLIARSLRDGAGRVWSARQRPPDFNGAWQPTFPLYAANPSEGMAPSWRPWVTPSAQRYDPAPPPRPGSAQHQHETREVLEISRALTPAQREAAQAWHLDAGSVTPGGLWMLRALDLIEQAQPHADESAAIAQGLEVTAAVAVALHDAFIACWRIKLRDWSERPITAIRRDLEPGFIPLLVTPGFPAYVSGHATVSAAACEVLCALFPAQRARLIASAQEAALSRLWGGIHFRCDNDEGLRLGYAVGREVVAQRALTSTALRLADPNTHRRLAVR